MNRTEVINSMIEGFQSGAKFQSRIRTFINEEKNTRLPGEVADTVAEIVTEYRQAADEIIERMSEEEQVIATKKRDNIINDVSRICRDLLEYSIVCRSRKNGTYAAKPWTKPEPKEKTTEASPDCPHRHFDANDHTYIPISDEAFLDIAKESHNKYGNHLHERAFVFPPGLPIDPGAIMRVATHFGVSFEDLAKHLLASLKKS
jgi:hypothetical protein